MYKIGIPFWKTGDNSFGATTPYLKFIDRFGEIVPLMPEHTFRGDLDLLILPGGADVDPKTYGATPGFYTQKPDIFKEHFDERYLAKYIGEGIPVFGICRGHQALAAFFGCNLIQHMWHETNPKEDGTKEMHKVNLVKEVVKYNDGKYSVGVNSRHHQVVSPKDLPGDYVVTGRYARQGGTGTIEAMAHVDLAVASVQWHPEDHYDKYSIEVIKKLLKDKQSILK